MLIQRGKILKRKRGKIFFGDAGIVYTSLSIGVALSIAPLLLGNWSPSGFLTRTTGHMTSEVVRLELDRPHVTQEILGPIFCVEVTQNY